MFARSKNHQPRKNNKETEKTFTTIVAPLFAKSSISLSSEATSPTASSYNSSRTNRTGDSNSYSYNSNDTTYIDQRASRRTYRVVSYKEDAEGKKTVFDIIDGRVYFCGTGKARRMTHNVVTFDSKQAALSERYPSNQYGAARSGNGIYPRVLVSFESWGRCYRRYGGGASTMYEFNRFMTIVEFLDPHCPVTKRLSAKYVEPHYFPGSDRSKPNREISHRDTKVDRQFNRFDNIDMGNTHTITVPVFVK